MKHAFIRKMTAGLAVMTLTMGMSLSAMADSAANPAMSEANPAVVDADGLTAVDFIVNFTNETKLVDGTTACSLPETVFTYSIASGTEVAATDTTPQIYAGPAGGAVISKDDTDAWDSVNGADTQDKVTVSLDASKFNKQGIYRYTITQADLTQEQKDLGIVADTTPTKYLDVYVSAKDGGTKIVTGVVMTETAAAPTLKDSNSDGVNDQADYGTNKDDSFDNKIKAYTLTLKKVVTGSMANKDDVFPFTMVLSYTEGDDAETTANGLKVYAGTATDDDSGNSSKSNTAGLTDVTVGSTLNIRLTDQEEIVISGLTNKVLAQIKETIAATEGYYISSTVSDLDGAVAVDASSHTQTNAQSSGTVKDKNATVTYTNNKDAVSPTGVVMQSAPYVLMIGFAAFFILAARRRRNDEDLA